MALVARHGATWFRRVGPASEPGSLLVTIGGHVARPGVYEVASGASLAGSIVGAGGSFDDIEAVLVGGYFGGWLTAATAATVALSHESLRRVGGALGCGVLVALPRRACGIAETARLVRWMAGENAGQCGPCVNGLPAIADAFERLAAGGPDARRAHQRLLSLLEVVAGRGACRHPDGTIRLVRSALLAFEADAAAHAHRRPCGGVPMAPGALPTPVPGAWR